AAMVIISSAVYSIFAIVRILLPKRASLELCEIGGSEHVPVHPFQKAFAGARNLVPCPIERVIAIVIAVRVRRMSAAWNLAYRAHHPAWNDDGVGRGFEAIDDLLDRDDRAARSEHRLLLNANDPPH